jgi:predicted O-methyltransferase YrrM
MSELDIAAELADEKFSGVTLPTDKFINDYVTTYRLIAEFIGSTGRVLEVGVAGGGSLQLWQALFPRGVVVGIDHDPMATWPMGTLCVIAEQDAPNLVELIVDVFPKWISGFDLIVDDASHQAEPSWSTFRLLWPLVRPGRWYVVEDWGVAFEGRAPQYEPEMLYFAQSMLQLFHPAHRHDVDEVRFRDGMIIIRKKGN